jgi:hypothetical protein
MGAPSKSDKSIPVSNQIEYESSTSHRNINGDRYNKSQIRLKSGDLMLNRNRLRVTSRAAALMVLIVATAVVSIQAQSEGSTHTVKPGEKAASPPASIADVAFIAGHWKGAAFGGICDEIWSPPEGNSMVGMFRLVKGGKAIFYELMTILEENNSLVMKLKHFSPDLNGWEEKNASQNFPLVKVGSNEAFFNTLSYRKLDDGSLQILVMLKQKSGEMAEEEFRLQPAAKWPATAKTLSRPTGAEPTVRLNGKSLMVTHVFKDQRRRHEKRPLVSCTETGL